MLMLTNGLDSIHQVYHVQVRTVISQTAVFPHLAPNTCIGTFILASTIQTYTIRSFIERTHRVSYIFRKMYGTSNQRAVIITLVLRISWDIVSVYSLMLYTLMLRIFNNTNYYQLRHLKSPYICSPIKAKLSQLQKNADHRFSSSSVGRAWVTFTEAMSSLQQLRVRVQPEPFCFLKTKYSDHVLTFNKCRNTLRWSSVRHLRKKKIRYSHSSSYID